MVQKSFSSYIHPKFTFSYSAFCLNLNPGTIYNFATRLNSTSTFIQRNEPPFQAGRIHSLAAHMDRACAKDLQKKTFIIIGLPN